MKPVRKRVTDSKVHTAGLAFLSGFFIFGVLMCLLTVAMLAFPGSFLEPLWRMNPDAQHAFKKMGSWAIVLMLLAGAGCLLAGLGLATRAPWGRQVAIAILTLNLLAGVISAVVRRDPRTLIGSPIAVAMILFLHSHGVKRVFTYDEKP